MRQKIKLFQVDAFTKEIFKGNPACVCILENKESNDALLQNIAMEMNLSETAFLIKMADGYNLRWFTPETEVDFCGHATLSAAHVLWENGLENCENKIFFYTQTGILSAVKKDANIELDFPAFRVDEIPDDERINSALGVSPCFTGTDRKRYLIEVSDYRELKDLRPDFEKLKKIGMTSFIVTCGTDDGLYDFYSRFFDPAEGINEDPVTGSAHSYLAPYWSQKLGKNILNAYQASKRGGEMECELPGNGRVLLRGNALTVMEIDMFINLK